MIEELAPIAAVAISTIPMHLHLKIADVACSRLERREKLECFYLPVAASVDYLHHLRLASFNLDCSCLTLQYHLLISPKNQSYLFSSAQ